MPTKATSGSACYDLYASEDVEIYEGDTEAVSTGLKCEFDDRYELQIRPRSSLHKLGLIIPNSPGTIDSDYRGEIKVLLQNTIVSPKTTGYIPFQKKNPVKISCGDRIAQLKISYVPRIQIEEVFEELSDTARGEGGFGSTGK